MFHTNKTLRHSIWFNDQLYLQLHYAPTTNYVPTSLSLIQHLIYILCYLFKINSIILYWLNNDTLQIQWQYTPVCSYQSFSLVRYERLFIPLHREWRMGKNPVDIDLSGVYLIRLYHQMAIYLETYDQGLPRYKNYYFDLRFFLPSQPQQVTFASPRLLFIARALRRVANARNSKTKCLRDCRIRRIAPKDGLWTLTGFHQIALFN